MKIQPKIAVLNRIYRMRRIVRVDTQRTRMKLLDALEEIFNAASSIARGEIRYQTVDGQPLKITLRQRQMWAKTAAYTAQIMNSIAESFDEKEIDEMLDVLERAVHEAKVKAEIKEPIGEPEKRLNP